MFLLKMDGKDKVFLIKIPYLCTQIINSKKK